MWGRCSIAQDMTGRLQGTLIWIYIFMKYSVTKSPAMAINPTPPTAKAADKATHSSSQESQY